MLPVFTGSHRFVLDYLSEEVLSRQPASVQTFLLQTSVLSRLCGSLCDAVTGQEQSQTMLEALERANLFVVALDDERQWYRYHHLFADVLRARLLAERGDIAELHRRAGTQWITEILRGPDAVLSLTSAGMEVRLGELYDGIALTEPKD